MGRDARRLLERVREMVQDASTKGERVSTASERASSVAERLARRLDASASDAEALVVRLAPVGEPMPIGSAVAPELRLVDDEPPALPEAASERPDERGESHDHDDDAEQRP
jgi:hypothetical protein